MKNEMITYLNERISWYKHEQERLRSECRMDEAAHVQIAINVYSIFLSTWKAVKYDLNETLMRFSSIVSVWDESHRRAVEHDDYGKKFIEEIKIARAMEIIQRAKELERMHHD